MTRTVGGARLRVDSAGAACTLRTHTDYAVLNTSLSNVSGSNLEPTRPVSTKHGEIQLDQCEAPESKTELNGEAGHLLVLQRDLVNCVALPGVPGPLQRPSNVETRSCR